MLSALALAATLATPTPAPAGPDLAYINISIDHATAPTLAERCAKAGLPAMLAVQSFDYATSLRNFGRGYPENDFSAKPFVALTGSKPLGLALSMAAWDYALLGLSHHSAALRCAAELRQIGVNLGAIANNNGVPNGGSAPSLPPTHRIRF